MPGDLKFSLGWKDEYQLVADQWNAAGPAQLERFIELIEAGERLMDAHHQAFFHGPARHEQAFRRQLGRVDENWFGEQPMWFRDCTLTVGQIHQVMRWSRAWTAELLLAGGGPVEFWLRCGHPRFRTVVTWEGGVAQPRPEGGQRWRPNPVSGPVRVWVYTPLNCAYGRFGERPTAAAAAQLEALGTRPRDVPVTAEELWELVHSHPGGTTIFTGTNLAVEGHPAGAPLPPAEGIEVTSLEGFVEPPEEGFCIDRPYAGAYATGAAPDPGGYRGYGVAPLVRPEARTMTGIEVSWAGAAPGTFLIHDCDRRALQV